MKIAKYADITPTHINNDVAKGVAARVVIGKDDGANNFCMRVFESLREEIRRNTRMIGSMRCLFMQVKAKFTIKVSGTKSERERWCLYRATKSTK
jgi:hypothetical protein